MTTEKTVLLIDHGSYYWQAWHSSVNEEVSAAHDRCVEAIRRVASDFEHVAICCDSPKSLRRERHPEYKAQRPAKDHASIEQLQRTKDTLERDGFLLWQWDGYEADDVIASAVRNRPDDCRVVVSSADKDLLQLVGFGVSVVSCKTGDVYDSAAAVELKLGVGPSKVRDWLALVGDKSDNVAGVPGIGAIKAAALLNEFGTIENTLAKLQTNATHPLFKPALAGALRDPKNLAQLAASQYLVTLETGLDVPFGEIFEAREVQPLAPVASGEFDDEEEGEEEEAPESAERQPEPASAPQVTPVPTRTEQIEGLALRNNQHQQAAMAQQAALNQQAALARSAPATTLTTTHEQQQLQPTSLKGAFLLAEHLYNSRLYTRFPNKEAIFAVIIRGREMGLTAMTALDSFHIIEGKPCPGAHLLITLAKQHPDCEYFRFVGGDATYAEYATKHRLNPDETRLRYTIEDAKQAGLMPEQPRLRRQGDGKDTRSNWEKRPAEMLRKTAAVQLARIEYPEALGGLYSQEELAA